MITNLVHLFGCLVMVGFWAAVIGVIVAIPCLIFGKGVYKVVVCVIAICVFIFLFPFLWDEIIFTFRGN